MQRFFNTAGPNQADQSYTLPPLTRFDLDEILLLIGQRRYFVLHAPRQTGKTTALLALQDYLNKDGHYICLYANIEAAQAARHNVQDAIRTITTVIASQAAYTLKEGFLRETLNQLRVTSNFQSELAELLQYWSEYASKPVILLLDEVDALVGDALISVLRQLRGGYHKRPGGFPSTVILCGVRDVRDYRIHTSDKEIITGGSAFNIKAVSLRLGDFSR
nr:AAA family ATPase [Anaerolineae bacterium]